jgi:uncharacterized Zn finger protein (UPF0148 family)
MTESKKCDVCGMVTIIPLVKHKGELMCVHCESVAINGHYMGAHRR